MTTDSVPPSAPTVDQRQIMRLLPAAAVIGIVAAIGSVVFMVAVEKLQELVYQDLPGAIGIDAAPWWWAAIMLAIGATVVVIAQRLPGRTGEGPLTGFHFDTPLAHVPSILLAAFGTLVFGMALGPEAPLIVVGTTIGLLLMRRQGGQAAQAGALLGGAAAIGAIFGNPFITAFMLLEFAAFGVLPAVLIPAVLVGLGSSYLVQIGIWRIPGVGTHELAVPGLPAYDAIAAGDLLVGLLVAIAAGIIAVAVRRLGLGVDAARVRRPVPVLYLAAAVTVVVLIVANGAFDIPLEQILFSGQTGMPGLVAETAAGTVLVILVGKAIAYGMALGSGFRGGPIFPATFLGVAVAVLASLLISSVSVTPLVAAGIAASAAAMIKLPATSALLGALLVGAIGAAVAPFAIVGAVIGLVIRLAIDRRAPGSDIVEV